MNSLPSSMLIDKPDKIYLGKISKAVLDKINQYLVASTNINQWKIAQNVLYWFDKIENKRDIAFRQFDIKNFYSSITMELLYKFIQFTKEITSVPDEDLHIIMHSRKTILFHNQELWEKREGGDDFYVPMGCYDGAEIYELVASFY